MKKLSSKTKSNIGDATLMKALLQDFADHYCDGQLPDLKPPKQAEKDQERHKKSPRSSVQLRRLHWQKIDENKAKSSVFAKRGALQGAVQSQHLSGKELQLLEATARDA